MSHKKRYSVGAYIWSCRLKIASAGLGAVQNSGPMIGPREASGRQSWLRLEPKMGRAGASKLGHYPLVVLNNVAISNRKQTVSMTRLF